MMIGKFSRSLYVGNKIEYLSFGAILGRIKIVCNPEHQAILMALHLRRND